MKFNELLKLAEINLGKKLPPMAQILLGSYSADERIELIADHWLGDAVMLGIITGSGSNEALSNLIDNLIERYCPDKRQCEDADKCGG